MVRVKRALISVSDKTGIVDFARDLVALGVEVLSTGGTCRTINEAGVPVTEISSYTGFPEMLSGRVKTLHPKVHGGLLGLRDDPEHRAAMEQHGIENIDLLVVNLYPFEKTVARPGVSRAEAVEQIDIGGPAMLRSAAKNHRSVGVVTAPEDYPRVLAALREQDRELPPSLLRELAVAAFQRTARYDAAIAEWLFAQELADGATQERFPRGFTLAGTRAQTLRYGENPHQEAALYRFATPGAHSLTSAQVLNGKALSYNNYVDLDAALRLASDFEAPFACVVKHNNPCGAASAATLGEAIAQAWAGDPVSAFGSVLAFNRSVDLPTAKFLTADRRFVEAIVAPGFDEDAFEHLTTVPKWGKNVRLLTVGEVGPKSGAYLAGELKPISGGFLVQDADQSREQREQCEVVTRAEPTSEQLDGLVFANLVAKHVKSNAIVIAKGTRVLGVGAGQMSRIDSVQLAIAKAGDQVQGAVLASDAFFPFPDGPETAMDAGITAILQPGGSVKDKAVIDACDERGVPMVFTGARHFRH
ncbi:bifunctional phosphoribosylaminoimidazolecarboxamide formyltransferase/IMP cyclohydrolase [Engelhardtia mirabilis]|uniref:Bifunctional purine biosynthesis protein PurH n=1 Tax=Engelhardtia mirabilis TaxID=2528011 RepID=A0A518BSM8_9BACT|nr:Bifunctional purine biosynthesis protein PurH [Planctomycetes bacterium Pla133]QDV04299.1 Bifunctional purine biosynthesis protein PurH [Planctomycetes bacterium Pla86]